MPRWTGVNKANEERILKVQDEVAKLNQKAARLGYAEAPMEALYKLAGQQLGDPLAAEIARILNTATGKKLRNRDADVFLIKHATLLEKYFPEMYRREELQQVLGAVEGRR